MKTFITLSPQTVSVFVVHTLMAAHSLSNGCAVYTLSQLSSHYWDVRVPITLHVPFTTPVSCPHIHALSICVLCLLFGNPLASMCCLCCPHFGSHPACVPFPSCLMSLGPPHLPSSDMYLAWSFPGYADPVLNMRTAQENMGGWTSPKASFFFRC